MDVNANYSNFHVSLLLRLDSTTLRASTTDRAEAREWARMLREAAATVDPDDPMKA